MKAVLAFFIAAVGSVCILLAGVSLFAHTLFGVIWQYAMRGAYWFTGGAGRSLVDGNPTGSWLWTPILLGFCGAALITMAWVIAVSTDRHVRPIRRSRGDGGPMGYRPYRRASRR